MPTNRLPGSLGLESHGVPLPSVPLLNPSYRTNSAIKPEPVIILLHESKRSIRLFRYRYTNRLLFTDFIHSLMVFCVALLFHLTTKFLLHGSKLSALVLFHLLSFYQAIITIGTCLLEAVGRFRLSHVFGSLLSSCIEYKFEYSYRNANH